MRIKLLQQVLVWTWIALLVVGCNRVPAEPMATPPPTSTSTTVSPTSTPTSLTPTHKEFVRQTFAYDPEAPLDIQEVSVEDRDGIQVLNIYYASPKGGQVPAYLVVPPGDGPFAGMLFLHWGLGNRGQFLDEALLLARRGTVSLLIDGPMNRRGYNGRLTTATNIQTVIDLQRGVDLLTARPDVEASRIGYVGHSFGAVWGGVLAGVETRISAYVLMAGHARISECADCGVSTTSYLHAIHYIGQAAPASVFFQFAERDEYITREAALEYYEACSEPRRIEWYDARHEFNERARLDRVEWLSAQLGLEPTPTIAPTFTPDPCTGWWCTVTGVVYAETTDFGNELEGVAVTLHQTSYCSPTSGQHQTTTGPNGGFEFSDAFFHDTDRIRIQVESEGYESAQWDSADFYCLYCGCFASPLEIVLHAALDP